MNSLFTRYRTSIGQFLKFGIVGGSGVIVNFIVVILVRRFTDYEFGITEHDVLFNLLGTSYNVRWYHVFITLAFIVANIWNFQLNRSWSFKSAGAGASWFKEFKTFFMVGLIALVVTLLVTTALLNPESPIALSDEIFDDSSGFRRKLYWANLGAIIVSTPVSFVLNKLWTFRAIRQGTPEAVAAEATPPPVI